MHVESIRSAVSVRESGQSFYVAVAVRQQGNGGQSRRPDRVLKFPWRVEAGTPQSGKDAHADDKKNADHTDAHNAEKRLFVCVGNNRGGHHLANIVYLV